MKNFFAIGIPALIIVVALVYFCVPSFRTAVNQVKSDLTSWSQEDIEADPIGYSRFVEDKLKADIATLESTRQNLAQSNGRLAGQIEKKASLINSAQKFAGEFAEAAQKGEYPVTIQNGQYNESQLRAQLSLILAQVDELTNSITEMQTVYDQSVKKSEEIVIQLEKNKSQLTMLEGRRELFTADKITGEGLAMLNSAKAVLENNEVIIEANPVITLEEMMARAEKAEQKKVSEDRVTDYIRSYNKEDHGDGNTDADSTDKYEPETDKTETDKTETDKTDKFDDVEESVVVDDDGLDQSQSQSQKQK